MSKLIGTEGGGFDVRDTPVLCPNGKSHGKCQGLSYKQLSCFLVLFYFISLNRGMESILRFT